MRILIQRVLQAKVIIDGVTYSQINRGLLVFVGIHPEDTLEQVQWLANKCCFVRAFEDDNQKMNLDLNQINGELLIVSQFTLYGSCLKGRRPEFTQSAKGDLARKLYEQFVQECQKYTERIQTGVFGADMKVELTNDGPVTLLIEK